MNIIEQAYKFFIDERFALPSEKQVADLEVRLRIKLPEDYRRFLLDYNGGYFLSPDIIPENPSCPVDCLKNLGGIGASHPSAELGGNKYNPDLFDNNDPPAILPIGYTLMGNLIYLVTQPEGCGVVGLKKAYSDEYFDLAQGIQEFFGLLRKHK
jgi:SMI1 / KNR4 family (SUKH-1)